MGNPAEIPKIDQEEKRAEKPVEARKREHPSWPVTIRENGEVLGLPEGISQKNVILFIGADGKWWAQNPSPELLEEIKLWRPDWQ